MAITISDRRDLRRLNSYEERKSKLENSLLKGVYPNCKQTLRHKDNMDNWLSRPANSEFLLEHDNLINDAFSNYDAIAVHIQAIIDLIEGT